MLRTALYGGYVYVWRYALLVMHARKEEEEEEEEEFICSSCFFDRVFFNYKFATDNRCDVDDNMQHNSSLAYYLY